jgi:nucleoside-diphosphate kinase
MSDKEPKLREEKTFLLIKPDGVRRGLIGEIIHRIEKVGLKIVALKMVHANKDKIDGFYPKEEAWINRLGEKTLKTYNKFGWDPLAELGTDKPEEIGPMVRGWLVDFMASAPVTPMVVQGVHAVTMVRKIVGETMPADAELGSIRGDYSTDSAAIANREKRAVYNIVHATETEEEAAKEMSIWFDKEEISEYRRTDDEVFSA